MIKKSVAVAYPTIPIIFLGGITPDRTPLYDTMGLAVTNIEETTRTETSIEVISIKKNTTSSSSIKFYLGEKEISGLRGNQIITSVENFLKNNNLKAELIIRSNNYAIFSGSSDSGLAALYTALNNVFELNYTKEELLQYSMKGSESAGRSLYGGLTLTQATKPIKVSQLASEKDLEDIKLFSIPFHYKGRISADEIHAGIVKNPDFQKRLENIPKWVARIKESLQRKDFISLLESAEENIQNAHELLQEVGLIVRKPKMMELCNQIHKMREKGIMAYFLIGGGNLITVGTTSQFSSAVEVELKKSNWKYYRSKVAGEPRITNGK